MGSVVSAITGGIKNIAKNPLSPESLLSGGAMLTGGALGGIPGALVGGAVANGLGPGEAGPAHDIDSALMHTITGKQVDDQYANVEKGLGGQQAFLSALQGQNGIQNQSNVFNQMQGIANGTGANPAQAMLNNSTGQNVANQAAIMASARGAGANPALMARQAAMQGANIQQDAAGQAAALQAQQQIAALNNMQGIAGQQVTNQGQATNAFSNAAQGAYGQTQNAAANFNNNITGLQGQQVQAEENDKKREANIIGGITGGLGSVFGMKAEGGIVDKVKEAFTAPPISTPKDKQKQVAPVNQEEAKKFMKSFGYANGGPVSGPQSGFARHMSGIKAPLPMAEGGKVPLLVSPGEKILDPKDVKQVAKGADPLAIAKTVPGKPKVTGAKNSYANDTVPTSEEEGSIVLPRSVTQAKNAPEKAKAFVAAIMKREALKKGK